MSVAFKLSSQRQGRSLLAALSTAPGQRSSDRRAYFDTFDWRLWRAGAALAASPDGEDWILNWRPEQGAAEHRERSGGPPAFARDLRAGRLRRELEPIVEMRRLLPLLELERHGEEAPVLDHREKTVARLRLEAWRVRATGQQTTKRVPPRLVAEPVRGFDQAFDELLDLLDDAGLERDPQPFLERAYEICGLDPGDYGAKLKVPLEPALPAHLAMRRIHCWLLDTMRRNEPGLREDLDSEFLHDFRVAVRRTRAALTQIKGVYPSRASRRFRTEFAWLGRLTGPLRDLDVYLLKLDDYRSSLPADVAADLDPLESLLKRKQMTEHRRVVEALSSTRYQQLLSEWALFLATEETPDLPAVASTPIADLARERLFEAHAKVVRRGRAIHLDSPSEKLHRLRIDCKKLRYLLEFFRGLYDTAELSKLVRALKRLQDSLGDFNDLSVQQRAMHRFADELAVTGAPPSTLLALGRLVAILERRRRDERRHFHDRFGRFDRPKVRKRLVRLVESATR